jgi:hypothetical protein
MEYSVSVANDLSFTERFKNNEEETVGVGMCREALLPPVLKMRGQ